MRTRRSANVRSPAQRASRAACSNPAIINAVPDTTCCGIAIQIASASALTPSATASKRENGRGSRPGLFRTSQLWVKLGTIRPPISMIKGDRGRDADADAVVGAAAPDRFGVEHDIAGDQYAEHDEDAKIAPVPAGGDLPRGQYRERGQECNVDHS